MGVTNGTTATSTRGPRREKLTDHRSRGRYVHAQADEARQARRQTLLVRSRGHARQCADIDGSHITTLVDTSHGDPRPGPDATKWCVGVAYRSRAGPHLLDAKRTKEGRTRPPLAVESSKSRRVKSAAQRTDVELLFAGLPEPIDLQLDLKPDNVWTDHGAPSARQHREPHRWMRITTRGRPRRYWFSTCTKPLVSRWTSKATKYFSPTWVAQSIPPISTARSSTCYWQPRATSLASHTQRFRNKAQRVTGTFWQLRPVVSGAGNVGSNFQATQFRRI